MRGGPVALRGRGNLLGVLLQVVDQFAQGRSLDVVRVDHQRVRHLRHHDDRLEFTRIVSELWIEALVDHQWGRRRRQQGVAIGRRMIGLFGADISGRACPIFDHDRLTPFARQPVRHQPRHRVGGSFASLPESPRRKGVGAGSARASPSRRRWWWLAAGLMAAGLVVGLTVRSLVRPPAPVRSGRSSRRGTPGQPQSRRRKTGAVSTIPACKFLSVPRLNRAFVVASLLQSM